MNDDRKPMQDEFRRIVDDGIRKDVNALNDGRQNLDAARSLLEGFRLCNPQDVPPVLFDWLHDVFGRILNGEEPDKALGLRRRRGQKKHTGHVDQIAIAMFVELETRRLRDPNKAKDAACEYFSREMDTILAAVKGVELNPDLSEKVMWEYIREHKRPE